MGDPDSETVIAKYYEPMMKFPFYLHGLPPTDHFFHLNISSLTFHFDELIILMTENKLNFDFLGIIILKPVLN